MTCRALLAAALAGGLLAFASGATAALPDASPRIGAAEISASPLLLAQDSFKSKDKAKGKKKSDDKGDKKKKMKGKGDDKKNNDKNGNKKGKGKGFDGKK